MKKNKSKTVFLDRDGVVNEMVIHKEQGLIDTPFSAEQMRFITGLEEPLRRMAALGYSLIIISNQPGLAKRQYSQQTFDALDQKLRDFFRQNGIPLLDVFYALSHPDANDPEYRKNLHLRKPEPGMLIEAAKKHNIELSKSFMVGDSWLDVAAGKAAGCCTGLIADRYKSELAKLLAEKKVKPDYYAKNMAEVLEIIEKHAKGEDKP